MSDYNGWPNRETWLIAVWYAPTTASDIDYLEDMLWEQYEAIPEGALRDMCSLHCVDWAYLRASMDDADAEESEE